MRLARSAPGWTIAVFGVMALVTGGVGLIVPDVVLAMLGFEVLGSAERATGDYTRAFLVASSVASFNMGVYYLLAAARDWRPFFIFTVPFRLLTFTVFTTLVLAGAAPAGFVGVGAWEGLGALATLGALWWQRRRLGSAGRTASNGTSRPGGDLPGATDGVAVVDASG